MPSSTLQKMLEEKRGYRTESYSGSGVTDLEEILHFEIGSLGNTDILSYLKENHGLLSDFSLDQETLEELKEAANDDEEYNMLIVAEEQELALVNSTHYIEQIMDFVEKKTGIRKATGRWLTTSDNVMNRYDGSIEDMLEYPLPNERIVLSDLGDDGTLFAYSE